MGEEPDVKEHLFEVLKQYAADRDVETLAEALPDILITEEHQQLIDSVRYLFSCRILYVEGIFKAIAFMLRWITMINIFYAKNILV